MVENKSPHNKLYHELAWAWQVISPVEEYVKETEFISKMININAAGSVDTLLHMGCGGGHNDFTFKKFFKVTGLDLSNDMLYFAKKLNKEVHYFQGDYLTENLGKKFDAVVLLDSINSVISESELEQAFGNAWKHLNPGGVFITMAEITKGSFLQNQTNVTVHTKNELEIVFIENLYDPDPRDTSYELTLVFLIRENNKLKIVEDRHIAGVFELGTWSDILQKVGFKVETVELEHSGDLRIPLFICTRE